MKSLLILGAGGFGRMVAETAQALGYEKVVFLDDAVKDEAVIGMCCDYEIRHKEYPVAVAAFGNNKMRLYWTDKLLEEGYEVPAIVHPSAVVSPSAVLEPGCFVMQRAVVNTNTRIGRAVLVNSGAIVDHNSVVCAGAHVGLGKCCKVRLYDRERTQSGGRRSDLLNQKEDRGRGQPESGRCRVRIWFRAAVQLCEAVRRRPHQ